MGIVRCRRTGWLAVRLRLGGRARRCNGRESRHAPFPPVRSVASVLKDHGMHDERPSRTSYKVALNILTLGAIPEMVEVLPSGIVDTTERLLLASGAAGKRTVLWSRSPRMVLVYRAFDWMMPGQFEAFAHRRAFCERQVREGIAAGATQVLVLGAGYDTMGWRLAPEFPGVGFFEIDHPATACLKARGIEEMGTRPNLHLIAEDLGERRSSTK